MTRHKKLLIVTSLGMVVGCGGSGDESQGQNPGPDAGGADGSTDVPDAGSETSPGCGDGQCAGTETCVSCPADCGCPDGTSCQQSTQTCESCQPDCAGRECGPVPNGCGASCGVCSSPDTCDDATGMCGCVATNAHDTVMCEDGSEWWVDDCGDKNDKVRDCGCGCGSVLGCTSPCDCTPTDMEADVSCHDGAEYSVDDCGVEGAKKADCECGCADIHGCETECSCTPTNTQDSQVCHDGAEWWVDDCGVEGAKKQDCSNGCANTDHCLASGSALWCLDLHPNFVVQGPAVATDGTIYVGSEQNVWALNPDGSQRWKLGPVDGNIVTPVSVGPDQTIYFGTYADTLYAVYPNQQVKWTANVSARTGIATSPDGRLYFFDGDGTLHAYDNQGQELWQLANEWVEAKRAPVVGPDGVVYASFKDNAGGVLQAISPRGQVFWVYRWIGWSPGLAMARDGAILLSLDSIYTPYPSGMRKIGKDGSELWTFETDHGVKGGAVVDSDGTIYFGSRSDKHIYALNDDGTELWSYDAGDTTRSTPVLGDSGEIYSAAGGIVFGLNSGSLLWSEQLPSGQWVSSASALTNDGKLLVVTSEYELCAYATDSSGLQSSTWPSEQGNAQNQGVVDTCTSVDSEFSTRCHDGAEWWLDNCGAETTKKGDCAAGCNDERACRVDGSMLWYFDAKEELRGGPAVDADGRVFIAGSENLFGVEADGTGAWSYAAPGSVSFGAVPTAANGRVFLQYNDGVAAVNATTGVQVWTRGSNIDTDVSVASDGTLRYGSNGDLAALSADGGTLLWNVGTRYGPVGGAPAIATDGTGFVGTTQGPLSKSGTFFAATDAGYRPWYESFDGPIYGSPAVGDDGTIYFASAYHGLYAYSQAGTMLWMHPHDYIAGPPVVGGNGDIYFVTYSELCAVSASGSGLWCAPLDNLFTPNNVDVPAVAADGTIFVVASKIGLMAFDPDGNERWTFPTSSQSLTAPSIAPDGTVYFGSNDHRLYAVHTTTGGLASSAWPKFRGNLGNTGNVAD